MSHATRFGKLTIGLAIPLVALTALAGGWLWFQGDWVADLFRADLASEQQIAQIKSMFAKSGVLAPLVYVAFVTGEVVVAPIPGLMLYAPGGLVFGPILGGLLAIIGNSLGAGIACRLTRMFGPELLERFFPGDQGAEVRNQLDRRGGWLIFFLRINPLTSTDLVSYAAGFTRISVWKVMLATACGMAPLCFLQSWLSDSLLTAFPKLIWPLLAACGCYVVAVIVVVQRLFAKRASNGTNPAEPCRPETAP